MHIRLWWTIPCSNVAWSWQPPLLVDAELTVEDGHEHLIPGNPIAGAPATYTRQSLADLTALFAQEANLLPQGMTITWLTPDTAVRWNRPSNSWTRHQVTDEQTIRLSPVTLNVRDTPSIRESYDLAARLLNE